jgi:predicted DNA-binding transcriptional regulator AlpA
MKDARMLLRFLSEREVSEITGLSVKTLQRWRLLNMGPPYRKFGGAVRYSDADISTWIASTPVGGGVPTPAA